MGGQELKLYIFRCDYPGCLNNATGPLDGNFEEEFGWLFLDKNSDGVPNICYCRQHRTNSEL